MNSKGNTAQEGIREVDQKKLRSIYIRIALTTLIFGFGAISIGLLLDFKFKQFPIYTLTAITLSFIIVIFIDMNIIKKSIKKISHPIDEQ